jgi:hypothetical protein
LGEGIILKLPKRDFACVDLNWTFQTLVKVAMSAHTFAKFKKYLRS